MARSRGNAPDLMHLGRLDKPFTKILMLVATPGIAHPRLLKRNFVRGISAHSANILLLTSFGVAKVNASISSVAVAYTRSALANAAHVASASQGASRTGTPMRVSSVLTCMVGNKENI